MINFKYKVLLIGPAAVGKTSLLHRFVDGVFKQDYAATIGAQFLTKEIEDSQLNLWDIGGQPRFLDLRTTFYRGTHGALLVFDLTRKETFEELNHWHFEMVKTLNREVPFVLIGNKLDLVKSRRAISKKASEKFAKERNSIYIETSALSGENVEEAFIELTRLIANRVDGQEIPKEVLKKALSKNFVKIRVRNYFKSQGFDIEDAVVDGNVLIKKINNIIDKAIENAKAAERIVIKPEDLELEGGQNES